MSDAVENVNPPPRDDAATPRPWACRVAQWVLVCLALVPFYDTLFRARSILSFDTRIVPPLAAQAPADLATRPANFVTSDLNGWIVPEATLTLEELRAGRLPHWNPYVLCGQPLLANLAFPPFYPPNWLALAFPAGPPLRAIAWLVALHLALAGVFAFRFLRGHGVAVGAAFCGGVGVEFATWLTTRVHLPSILATAAWFFAILLALDRILAAPSRRATAWLALAVGMATLAGFPQLLAVELGGAALYFAVRLAQRSMRGRIVAAGSAAAGTVLGIALGAVQTLPALALLPESLRAGFVTPQSQVEKALEPVALIGVVLPRFFAPAETTHGDAAHRESDYAQRKFLGFDAQENPVENALWPGVVILCALPLLFPLRRNVVVAFLLLVMAGLLLAVESPLLAALYAKFPALATASPKRALALVAFAMPALAAFAIDAAARDPSRARRFARVSAVAAVSYASGALLVRVFAPQAEGGATFAARVATDCWFYAATAAACGLLWRFRPGFAPVGCAVLAALELGGFARRFNPPQDLEGQYPTAPALEFLAAHGERSARFENERVAPAPLAPLYGMRCFDGAEPMVLRRTGEFIESIEPGRFERSDPRMMAPLRAVESLRHPAFLRAATPNIVVSRPLDGAGLPVVHGDEAAGVGVYRQDDALPRVRLVGGARVVRDVATRLRLLSDPTVDPRATVLLEESPGPEFDRDANVAAGTARIVAETPGELTIELTGVVAPALLYVADTFAPGWTAEVDDRPARVLAADHAFRAVPLGSGATRVVLRYEPPGFIGGALATLCALGSLLAMFALRRERAATRHAA